MGIVKANAYGHGAVRCALRLQSEGAKWFGVALPEEGIELRRAGVSEPILCLGGFWPGQAGMLVENALTPVVFRSDALDELDQAARSKGQVVDAHIKIDTGMGRLGVRFDELSAFVKHAGRCRNIRIEGLMTHFASADVPEQRDFTQLQANRFETALDYFRSHGIRPVYHDLANSAATVSYPFARGNLVRPGGILYGLWRDILQPNSCPPVIQNVMTLFSRIELLKRLPAGEPIGYGCTFRTKRKSLIATLPIGYDDGFVRANSNAGRVLVRGNYAPVVGRVSMDLTIIDVTDVPGVELFDKVTLIGEDGSNSVYAENIASTAGTLSYEITCGISERVPRIYID